MNRLYNMAKMDLKINKIVKYLILSDAVFYSAMGMVNPIIAVFFTDHIADGSLAVAGIASSIYFVISGILQIPFALLMDKVKGEVDDYWFMLGGCILMSLTLFLYIFASTSWHIYLIQALSAIGYSLAYPAWTAIFSRHLDKGKEGFEWSVYNTLISFGSALAAGVGAYVADQYGFQALFFVVGCVTLVSNLLLLAIFETLFQAKTT
jgi:MFS family permease